MDFKCYDLKTHSCDGSCKTNNLRVSCPIKAGLNVSNQIMDSYVIYSRKNSNVCGITFLTFLEDFAFQNPASRRYIDAFVKRIKSLQSKQ